MKTRIGAYGQGAKHRQTAEQTPETREIRPPFANGPSKAVLHAASQARAGLIAMLSWRRSVAAGCLRKTWNNSCCNSNNRGIGGFTLIEMMLVLIVVMSLMTLELKRKSAEMSEHASIAAGRHMKTVADATNAYLVNNYGPLMAGTDPNCLPAATWPCYLNPNALVTQQILPASFILKTAWDSDYSIAITRVGAAPYYNLNGLVLSVLPWTSDGTSAGAPKLAELGRAAIEMGPDGGFSMTTTEVSGLKGGWIATTADSNKINATGQLASRAGYASSVFAQFLRRDGTLPMTGNLSMGLNSIQQAVNVSASGTVSGNAMSSNTSDVAGTLRSNSITNATSIATNDLSAANNVSSTTLSTGLVSVTGNASIGGNVTIAGTASVTGALSTSSINNSGNATIGGTATLARLGGNLEVVSIASDGAACAPNGRLAQSSAGTGAMLVCISGLWSSLGGGIGTGQTWQNLAGSRAVNTAYVNDTSKPIMIVPTIYCQGTGNTWKYSYLYINGIHVGNFHVFDYDGGDGNVDIHPVSFIVPVGQTYQMNVSGACYIHHWAELR